MSLSHVLRRLTVLPLLAALIAAATGCAENPTAPEAQPTRILVLEDGGTEDSVAVFLRAQGHTVTMGGPHSQFRGAGLADHDVVLLLSGPQYTATMPDSAQQKLVNFVANGGGLMTTEWVHYLTSRGAYYSRLRVILPATYGGTYQRGADTCRVNGVHPIAVGLPQTFVTSANWGGSRLQAKTDPALRPEVPIIGSYTASAVVTGVYGTGRTACWSMAGHYYSANIWSRDTKMLLGNITAWLAHER